MRGCHPLEIINFFNLKTYYYEEQILQPFVGLRVWNDAQCGIV